LQSVRLDRSQSYPNLPWFEISKHGLRGSGGGEGLRLIALVFYFVLNKESDALVSIFLIEPLSS